MPTAIAADWTSLLAAARDGDDHALGAICEQFRCYLQLAAARDLGVGLQAKLGASDVVQDTLLEACRDFGDFRGDSEEEFRVWIRRLVQHNLCDAARRYRDAACRDVARESRAADRLLPLPDASCRSPSSIVRRREFDEQLLRVVALLPERQRRLIELRHRQGLGYREISQRLGVTEAAARKLWSRTVETVGSKLGYRDAR